MPPAGDPPSVVVVGGANLDVKARTSDAPVPATSNPGTVTTAAGGVGRNIAEALARLGTPTWLVAAIGQDAAGEEVVRATAAAGVHVEHVTRSAERTGSYVALLDDRGELVAGVADMRATDQLDPDDVSRAGDRIRQAGLVVLDGNLAAPALARGAGLARAGRVRLVLDPVSVPKARRLLPLLDADLPPYAVTPDREELAALTGVEIRTDRGVRDAAALLHERGVEVVWVREGAAGSLLSRAGREPVQLPALPTRVVDVTGAGDAMLAAFCHALLRGRDEVEAARLGHAAAALTIAVPESVRTDLTESLLVDVLAGAVR